MINPCLKVLAVVGEEDEIVRILKLLLRLYRQRRSDFDNNGNDIGGMVGVWEDLEWSGRLLRGYGRVKQGTRTVWSGE